MIAYFIKSILCLLVLWGFYKIALEQQSAHIFKRFYLLASLVIALLLPLITISYTVPAVSQSTDMLTYVIPTIMKPSTVVIETTNWLSISLWAIYALGVLVFGVRFLRNIGQIRSTIRQNMHVFAQKAVLILIERNIVPHTFLNYIFLPRAAYETNCIPQEILRHEQAHVTQKHTLDILFIEVLQVIFWFNPLLHFIKRSIALNHEFLADQKAIDRHENPERYINLLVYHAQSPHHAPMTSALNYSLTRPPYRRAKKRILMISQSFSVKKLVTRLAFLVPILALCIYFFNQEIVAKPINDNNQTAITSQQIQEPPTLKVNISEETVTVNGKETNAEDFVKTIDQITAKWTEKEIMSYSIHLQSDNGVNQFVGKLANAFHNTRLYKTNPAQELIPPPPAPAKLSPSAMITIQIDNNNNILIENQPTTLSKFKEDLGRINSEFFRDQNMAEISAVINLASKSNYDIIQKLEPILVDYGIRSFQISYYETPMLPVNATSKQKAEHEVALDKALEKHMKERYGDSVKLPESSGNPWGITMSTSSIIEEPAPAENESKTLRLNIQGNQVLLNDKEIKVIDFAESLDNITKDWKPAELKNARLWLKITNPDKKITEQLEEEYKKTRLYEAQPGHGLILPPPPDPASPEFSNISSPIPPIPPAPPTPPSPEKILEEMTTAGADFYYNGDTISAEKAKKLFKSKNNLSFMATEAKNGNKPMVLITDN